MNLRENIQRVIRESLFLKRRVTTEELNDSFEEALDYATEIYKRGEKENPVSFANFGHSIISMMIDDFHPRLIEDDEDFPYKEIFKYLENMFMDRITDKYREEFVK